MNPLEKPQVERNEEKYTFDQFKSLVESLDADNLRDRLVKLSHEHSQINLRITEAKTRAAGTGEFSDPEWFHRARKARAVKQTQIDLIRNELTKRQSHFYETFYNLCKTLHPVEAAQIESTLKNIK